MNGTRRTRSRRWPFLATVLVVMTGALVFVALADWWRARRVLQAIAAESAFMRDRWQALLDYKPALQRLAAGRLAQRWAVQQAMNAAQPNTRLMAAWAICVTGQEYPQAGRIVVNEAMADMVMPNPADRVATRETAWRAMRAAVALKDAGRSVVVPLLEVAADQAERPERRQLAIIALSKIDEERVRAALLAMLRSEHSEVRALLFTAMAQLGEQQAAPELRRAALSDPDHEYRKVAAAAYRRLTGKPVRGPSTQPAPGTTTQRDR